MNSARLGLSAMKSYLVGQGNVPSDSGLAGSVVKKCWQGTSQIQWANPAPIDYGTALSEAQLNAVLTSGKGDLVYDQQPGAILEPGEHTLRVSVAETWKYAAVEATVTLTVRKLMPAIEWSKPANIDYGTALSDTQLNAKAKYQGLELPGTMTYQPAKDTILDAGSHDLQATFVPTDTDHYENPDPKRVKLTVSKVTPTVTWENPAAIVYDTPCDDAQLSATATYGGKAVAGKCKYSSVSGKFYEVGTHKLKVVFVPDDTSNYRTVEGEITLTVTKASVKLTWNNPADITYGTLLSNTQLNATRDVEVEGQFAYNPGKEKKLDGGARQKLRVTFTPRSQKNYEASQAEVEINVNPATPTITWNPLEIKQNTALGDAQLNAEAVFSYINSSGATQTEKCAGTYAYVPASGTNAGAAGVLALAVTFTPDNKARFNAVTGHASVSVVRVTTGERRTANISEKMEDKVLRGKIKPNGDLIGAHSRSILTDPSYNCTLTVNNANGTVEYTVRKKKPGGAWSNSKSSTLPPSGWNDDMFWDATLQTAGTPVASTDPDGSTTHQAAIADTVNGGNINWVVIKDSSGKVTASYPKR